MRNLVNWNGSVRLTFWALLSHMHANKTHALPHTLTLGINPRLRYQSISRSLGPPDVNKLGNPILYIFQACQSVRMKCCLLPLGKFLLSLLAECSSSFISLSMNRCAGTKSCVTCQIWCYFQKFTDHPQRITSSIFHISPETLHYNHPEIS